MDNNSKQTDPFAFLDSETPEENTNQSEPAYQIEAFQVVKIGGKNAICRRRETIDTVYVSNGNVEFARGKAQNIADLTSQVMKYDCMVVEKLERIVSTHFKK
jgi:hypothetical protein